VIEKSINPFPEELDDSIPEKGTPEQNANVTREKDGKKINPKTKLLMLRVTTTPISKINNPTAEIDL
jgi:hypothetical protein